MVMEKRVIKSLIIEKQNEIPTMEIMPRKLELEETVTTFLSDFVGPVSHI